ncbi:hypothetical protein L7F22_046938 [Adiantum nelumboides]|nr:hypothetical protein [Adiantum nelumboides]
MEKGVENPYQELKQLLEGKPSSKKKGHAQHERSPSRERDESESLDKSMEDVAPRRRRAQRSPTLTKRKRSPHSPHRGESKREEKNSKKKKERKRSPSSPSSSPSSSSDEGSGYSSQEKQRRGHQKSYAAWKRSSKLNKFKEGGKNISFLTYDACRRPLSRLVKGSHAPVAPSQRTSLRYMSADHHGPPRVNFWEDPMSPSKWKEEHFVLVSLAGWGLFGYGAYKGISSLVKKPPEKEEVKASH